MEGLGVEGGFDFVVCECVLQVFCDECHPGEWWSAYWALVWCDVVLDGSLCRVIRIESEDVAKKSKSTFSELGADR